MYIIWLFTDIYKYTILVRIDQIEVEIPLNVFWFHPNHIIKFLSIYYFKLEKMYPRRILIS